MNSRPENIHSYHRLLLLLLSLMLMSCAGTEKPAAPEAISGLLDLSKHDFSKNPDIPLIGEWAFYWNSLKTPVDFQDHTELPPPAYAWGPRGWTSSSLPPGVSGKSPFFGYATYRMRVLLPETPMRVGVYLPQQHSAYRVYLNGVLSYINGRVDEDPSTYRGEWKPGAVSLAVPDGKLDVILQIANFTMKPSGYFYPIRIGAEEAVLSSQRLRLAYEAFILGALVILAVYYLFFSYFQGWDSPSLLLSASSFLYGLRTVTHGEILLAQFQTLDLELINRIRYLTLFILPLTIFAFVRRILTPAGKTYRLLEHGLLVVCAGFCLFVLLTPVSVYVSTLDFFFIILLIAGLATVAMSLEAIFKGTRSGWALLAGFVLLILSASMDLYSSFHRVGGYAYWSPLGFFLFSLFYALVLGKKFATALQREKDLSGERGRAAEILDLQVQERTEELREMNRSLETVVQEANKASKAKTDFLAMMSHEIRTPMNAIVGITEMLGRTRLNQVQRDYLGTLCSATDNLLFILDDILDFARLESGRIQIDIGSTNLRKTVDEAVAVYLPGAMGKGLYLRVEVEDDCPPFVLTDAHRLKQILANLIGNALKFTSVGGVLVRVEIDAGLSSDHRIVCRFMIKDTGIGIPRDKIKRIFESFEQADGSTTRKYGGTGLGLAISKKLVELLGGSLEVESEEGRGSTFRISLPFEKAESAEPADSEMEGECFDAEPGYRRILLVEDNTTNILVAKAIMSSLGWSCGVAETGREALDLLSREEFDVVLMDLEIPVLDGMETTRLIREGKAGEAVQSIPIIAMTAHALPMFREEALKAGMNGYLTKPVTRLSLVTAVTDIFPRQRRGHVSHLNVEAALQKFEGNMPFLLNLYQAFSEDITNSLASIEDALEKRDFGDIVKLSRTIESSALLLDQKRTECLAGELSYAALEKNAALCAERFRVLEPELLGLREKIHLILAEGISIEADKADKEAAAPESGGD